jgi:hypothetical protein
VWQREQKLAFDFGLQCEMLFARKGAKQRERSLIQLRAQPFPADADAFTVPPLGESADVALFINCREATEISNFSLILLSHQDIHRFQISMNNIILM